MRTYRGRQSNEFDTQLQHLVQMRQLREMHFELIADDIGPVGERLISPKTGEVRWNS